MIKRPNTKAQRVRRHQRVRGKISGTAERPRLSVFRSENNIYAQIIDDVAGKTLCSASTVEKGFEGNGGTGDFFLYKGETRRIIIFPVGSAGGIYLRPVLH